MRVLFSTMPWLSHLYPMVPLAWTLAARGHEVRVASFPSMTPTTVRAGLTAVECGVDLWAAAGTRVEDNEDDRPERGEFVKTHFAETLMDNAEHAADDLLALARSWCPDVIVYAPLAYSAQLTAQLLGIPAVAHLWGVADASELHRKNEAQTQAALWARFGLDTVSLADHVTVDPCPPSLQVPLPGRRQVVRYVPYNGSGVLPAWLAEPGTAPRVCVTWGTSTPSMTGEMTSARNVAAVLAAEGVEVVVAVADSHVDLLGELPGIRTAVSLPLGAVLEGCALIVHHGGPGTMLTAAAAGLPQLVMPISAGQFLNADRLAAIGAGVVLDPETTTDDELRAAAGELLHGGTAKEAAASLRREIERQPPPSAAADLVERLGHGGAAAADSIGAVPGWIAG